MMHGVRLVLVKLMLFQPDFFAEQNEQQRAAEEESDDREDRQQHTAHGGPALR